MKLVSVVLKPFKVSDVLAALETMGVIGITVSEVSGHGRQKGHTEFYRGAEYKVDLLPKIKLETVVAEDMVEDVIRIIVAAARSGEGRIGDGKIWVTNIEQLVRVRTGEQGLEAI